MLYPNDIEAAADSWSANCGPCALAALLEVPVNQVRDVLDGFDQRKYMNITHMKNALDRCGIERHSLGKQLPQHGLAFIQWGGHEAKPHFVQYQFTHWIAVYPERSNVVDSWPYVFEVNAPRLVRFDEWQRQMSRISKGAGWGDGTYFVRAGIEVSF
ncbi:MAG TPA: hypothetical protein VIW64_09365 [Pyrinomonadaceae bacterium]|jgi:hypothetical protein